MKSVDLEIIMLDSIHPMWEMEEYVKRGRIKVWLTPLTLPIIDLDNDNIKIVGVDEGLVRW